MRRPFIYLCLVVVIAGLIAPNRALSGPCAALAVVERIKCENSAPGDEYFGRMKLSFLTIMNTFRDEFIRSGAHTTDTRLISRVNFADDALQAWASKYPRDPALPRSYFLAVSVYKKIYTHPAQLKAWSYIKLLSRRFGNTPFGESVKRDLAVGFMDRSASPHRKVKTKK